MYKRTEYRKCPLSRYKRDFVAEALDSEAGGYHPLDHGQNMVWATFQQRCIFEVGLDGPLDLQLEAPNKQRSVPQCGVCSVLPVSLRL